MNAMSSDADLLHIRGSQDIVAVRQVVRARAVELGFSLVNITKVVTAASELARNAVVHGGGGVARLELVQEQARRGLRLVFSDEGAGIPDIALAMKDGYSSGSGLGLGLGGAKRLMGDLVVRSEPYKGTTVTAVKWK